MLRAAGVDRRMAHGTVDLDVCREVAYRMAVRGRGRLEPVLAVAEDLLGDEANYEFTAGFLEAVQNVASHGIEKLHSADEVRAALGPRCAKCWAVLTMFWDSVAVWCGENGVILLSNEKVVSAEHEEVRTLLWTCNRSLPDGTKLGLVDAVRFERASPDTGGGVAVPGYSHIATVMKSVREPS
jgi:hypothetical protein